MATIKSYTTIEQSRKLAEILSLESADIYYFLDPTPAGNVYHLVVQQIDFGVKTREPEYDKGDIPCWSIAALLDVYPMVVGRDMDMYCCWQNSKNLHSRHYDNPIDACYEMILKLHELNLL